MTADQRPGTQLDSIRDMMMAHKEEILPRVERLFAFTEEAPGSLDRFVEGASSGLVPVIIANHQAHPDGVGLSYLAGRVLQQVPHERLKGFILPFAASMEDGRQGPMVQGLLELFGEICDRQGVEMVGITRPKDRRPEEGISTSELSVLKRIFESPKEGMGLIGFPEGRVEGGRTGIDGSIKGMQQAEGGEHNLFLRFLKRWKNNGAVVLPVGLNGSYKLFSPTDYSVPDNVFCMVAGLTPVEPVADIKIGEPITIDATNFEGVTMDSLMRKVASLVPEEAKGVYRSGMGSSATSQF